MHRCSRDTGTLVISAYTEGNDAAERARHDMATMTTSTRTERDSLGEVSVPADALYGAQTARAVENFPISGIRPNRTFIESTAMVKWAAAMANMAIGKLP